MKLVMDERLKHRLVGLAVVISFGAIFAPAIMKQSSQRFDDKKNISIKLPSRPNAPKVLTKNEPALFKRMTVAHVTLPAVREELKPISTLARAEPLGQLNGDLKPVQAVMPKEPDTTITVAESEAVEIAPSALIAAPLAAKKAAAPSSVIKKASPKMIASVKRAATKALAAKKTYAVQLGTFSQQKNAVALVSRLKNKGYRSFLIKSNSKHGAVYRVLVGQTAQRQDAKLLQQKLASAEQVNGFIVPTNGLG